MGLKLTYVMDMLHLLAFQGPSLISILTCICIYFSHGRVEFIGCIFLLTLSQILCIIFFLKLFVSQVIAVGKSSDLVLMVLDASKVKF